MRMRTVFALLILYSTWTFAVPLKLRTGHKLHHFEVELARTESEQKQGLMHRTTLAHDAGMLFVYKTPRVLSMWMKNTPLSLDMLFFDQEGKLIYIKKKTTPFSEETIVCPTLGQAVLEVPAGTADKLEMKVNITKLMLNKPLSAF